MLQADQMTEHSAQNQNWKKSVFFTTLILPKYLQLAQSTFVHEVIASF